MAKCPALALLNVILRIESRDRTQKAHPFQDGLFTELMPAIT
jgi:hypothetical protein